MKDFAQAVATAFDQIASAGVIEKQIHATLQKTIESAVNDALRSYSDFGKKLDEAVKSALAVDFNHLGLPLYNDIILKIVREKVGTLLPELAAKQFDTYMADLLSPAPASIKLSELVEQYIESEADSHRRDGSEHITLIVEDNDSSGFKYVHLDANEGRDKYSCEIQFGVTRDGRVYRVSFGKQEITTRLIAGPLYGFHKTLFGLYAAGTCIEFDEDADYIDTAYPEAD